MTPLFHALQPLLCFIIRHPARVLAAGLLLTALGAWQAAHLRIDSDFSKLIPAHYASVQALEKLRQTVGGESDAAVVIESPSFEANRRFAEALIPQVLGLRSQVTAEPTFTHVDYRRDTAFLERNALYLATDAELDSLEHYLDAQIEAAKLEANPFYFDLEEDDTPEAGDAAAEQLNAAYDRLVGTSYPISDDSTTLVLRFYPSGSQTDVAFIEQAYHDLQAAVTALDPGSYHPDMEVTLAGRLLRQLMEVQAITDDVQQSFGAGVLTVLLMVVAYFGYKSYLARAGRRFARRVLLAELVRMPATALVIGVPLFASLAWTFGAAHLMYGALNLMTSTLGLVLFGLGIDYGIHFYGRYAEERGQGRTAAEAVEATFLNTGPAIMATALTTAAAFFLLMLADFRGFSEFGFIAGTGILFALVAMMVLLPALVILFERLRLLNLTVVQAPGGGRAKPLREAPQRVPRARRVLGLSALGVGASVLALPFVAFEYDFAKLEPEYEEYQVLQRGVRQVYDDQGRRNPAYVIVDDPAEAPAVEAALRARMEADTLSPTIRDVETLQGRFPMTPEAQQARLRRIADLRALLNDPYLQAAESADMERLRRAASTAEPITLDEVPASVKAPFTAKDGTLGRLIVIYPSVGLSDGRQSMAFADDVGTITTAEGHVYHAGSTSLVAADMLQLMRREAPLMVGLTLALIVALKLWILRSVRLAVLALVPLLAGFLGLFGLMVLLGVSLNFYNLVVLPAVLGLGDDAGIHLVHRYTQEGVGSIRRVLRSTGEHITMSALTTIVGFAGLLLSFHPGLRSIGELAVIGIGMTLLAALVFLPALLQVLEDRAGREQAPDAHAWIDQNDRSEREQQPTGSLDG